MLVAEKAMRNSRSVWFVQFVYQFVCLLANGPLPCSACVLSVLESCIWDKNPRLQRASLFSYDDLRRRLSIFFGGDSCRNSADAWCDTVHNCTEKLCSSGKLSSKKLPWGMGSTILLSCERPEWNRYLNGYQSWHDGITYHNIAR